MKKTLLLFSLFAICTSFSQNENKNDRLLTYGLSFPPYESARKLVALKWGFEIYPVAGCMISEKLMDSVQVVNKTLWKKLDESYGENSKKRFRQEVIQEMKRIEKVEILYTKDRSLRKKLRKLERLKDEISSHLDSISKDGQTYFWTVYSFSEKNNPTFKWESEFRVGIHFVQERVEIIINKQE